MEGVEVNWTMNDLNDGVPTEVTYRIPAEDLTYDLEDVKTLALQKYEEATGNTDWSGLTDRAWSYWMDLADEELQKIQSRLTVDRLLSDFEPDTSYYEFPGGVEVRQISAHLASFPAQIVQYAARSGRMDGKCKSEELSDRIRDFEKIRDFATWEIERLGDL